MGRVRVLPTRSCRSSLPRVSSPSGQPTSAIPGSRLRSFRSKQTGPADLPGPTRPLRARNTPANANRQVDRPKARAAVRHVLHKGCPVFWRFHDLTRAFILAGLLVVSDRGALLAQSGVASATVTGRAHDQSGAPIAGAAVSLHHLERNQTLDAVTNDDGGYRFVYVPVGSYRSDRSGTGFFFADDIADTDRWPGHRYPDGPRRRRRHGAGRRSWRVRPSWRHGARRSRERSLPARSTLFRSTAATTSIWPCWYPASHAPSNAIPSGLPRPLPCRAPVCPSPVSATSTTRTSSMGCRPMTMRPDWRAPISPRTSFVSFRS